MSVEDAQLKKNEKLPGFKVYREDLMMAIRIRDFMHEFVTEAAASCEGRNWVVRVPLLGWCGYVLFRYLTSASYSSIISPLNLGIHELGHLVFSPFGEFMSVLGGTILQLLAPLFGVFNFYRQGDFFSIALSCGWLSVSLFDAARYVADARAMELPLVSPFGGDGVIHDWNYLLSRMGLLQFDVFLARFIQAVAVLSMFLCLAGGAWMLWQMHTHQREPIFKDDHFRMER